MHATKGRGQSVDAGGYEVVGLFCRRFAALQFGCVNNPIFAGFDAPRLRFRDHAHLLAIGDQLARLAQLLLLLVVTHIHHDAVEGKLVRAPLDEIIVLRMVHV